MQNDASLQTHTSLYSSTDDNSITEAFLISFFAALCLFLSAVEYAIPKPLPFMRLGLANLPVLLSLSKMRKRDTLALIALKVLGQALISGTLFSYVFVFSAAGSFASGLTMLLLYTLLHNKKVLSYIGLSLAGALANNCAQIAVARVMIFGESTRYIAPVLFTTGVLTGFVLGIFANIFCSTSIWYGEEKKWQVANGKGQRREEKTGQRTKGKGQRAKDKGLEEKGFAERLDTANSKKIKLDSLAIGEFICALILFPVFLLQKNTAVIWGLTGVFYIMTMIKRHGKVKILPSLFMTIGVTFFALLSPFGKVIFSIGSFHITQDALSSGLHKSGILVGMVFLSQFAISPRLNLPGTAGQFLSTMLTVFDKLTSKRISFKRGHVVAALDERLVEIWNDTAPTF